MIRARDRKAKAALQLRRDGIEWDDIAEVIGYPTGRQALIACERALESELRTDESKEFMRNMAGRRLERLLRSVLPKALDPQNPEHLNAATKAREIIRDHVNLYGLAAPTEVVMHSPTTGEIEAWVGAMIEKTRPAIEEADIFGEGEIIEGEWEETRDAVPVE